MLKKIWNDPVWSKVIATTITAGAVAASAYVLGWSKVGGAANATWSFLRSSANIPRWVLIGLILWMVVLIRSAVIRAWVESSSKALKPLWASYKTDTWLGLRWRWNYDAGWQVENLVCFCPRCDYQVHPHSGSPFTAIEQTAYYCEICKGDIASHDGSFDMVCSRVTRLIQQKIRTQYCRPDGKPRDELT